MDVGGGRVEEGGQVEAGAFAETVRGEVGVELGAGQGRHGEESTEESGSEYTVQGRRGQRLLGRAGVVRVSWTDDDDGWI